MWQRHDSSKSQVLAIRPCLAKLHVLCRVPGHQLSLGTESTCSCRVVCADWRLATSGWEGGQCAQLLSVTALSSWQLSRDNWRPPHGDWRASAYCELRRVGMLTRWEAEPWTLSTFNLQLTQHSEHT